MFASPGRRVVACSRRTWVPPHGAPSHAEVGYLRPTGDGAELVLAHPSGVLELSLGTVRDDRLELTSRTVATTPTAKAVTEVRRTYKRRGDVLWYRLDLAPVGLPLRLHCEPPPRATRPAPRPSPARPPAA